jgi:integrase
MRRVNKLSSQFVRQRFIKPGKYGDGQNLYLVVSSETARSWVFRYTLKGVEVEKGLGSAWDLDLAEARFKAADLRRLLASGIDPTEHLNPKKIPTFEEMLAEYVGVFASRWTNAKSPHQWLKTVEYVPDLAKMPVDQIKTADVKAALLPIWTRIKEVASRTRGRIEAVLDYAKHQGYRDGDNPARWKGCLEYVLPQQSIEEKHHRALRHEDVPSFYTALCARSADASVPYRFCILTATRTEEVRMARWEEIDLAAKTWNIPKVRMKGRRPFRIPLPTAAVEILEKIGPKADGYVFEREPGRPFSNNALLALRDRMGFKEKCTTHGFRSSFREWVHHKGFDRVASEKCLDHQVLGKAESAYLRDDLLEQRREILAQWAEYVTQQPTTSVVINLRRSSSNGAI